MKFTRKNTVTNLKEGRNYKGTIFDIQHIELKKRSYGGTFRRNKNTQ